MISVEVKDPKSEAALAKGGWKIQHVEKVGSRAVRYVRRRRTDGGAREQVEEPWYGVHPKCRQFTTSQMVRWGKRAGRGAECNGRLGGEPNEIGIDAPQGGCFQSCGFTS